ncbi:hypothetical protein [Sphingobium sp. HDIP04]|uniref:hypothetical protein n=1 Tax=Sphingobium sp. HDIP04 TaxID=428994 RepID=UPI0003877F66|nr:hypothetical protein [Sphingobium sp. HDIP04]EQA97277.1 hypothetical protein L286_23415 [Sphingobium sp. HDIP04]
MASVPYEASEIHRFTPDALANIENPPVFRLRAVSRRERRRYDRLMIEEGLRLHDREAMRAETLRGLRALSSDDEFETWEPLLRQHWDARDEWEEEHRGKPIDDIPDFTCPGPSDEEISTVTRGIHENWPPLRKLAADNVIFNREAPALLISVVLAGWSGIATPFSSREGVLSLDTVEALDADLTELEKANGLPEGKAFVELYVEASNRMFLSKEAEKNSLSPPPSPTDQPTSTTGTESQNGTSTASAISDETPAT